MARAESRNDNRVQGRKRGRHWELPALSEPVLWSERVAARRIHIRIARSARYPNISRVFAQYISSRRNAKISLTVIDTRNTPMGNTCASIHIAWRGNVDDAAKAVSRGYSKLGYERLKKAPAEGDKHVVVLARAGQSFVSVFDSDNAQLDSGELKDLALAASKTLKTAAVFTSLYDSDTYEFIIFANGRQVDLLMTDGENYEGPMKGLSDKLRAAKWSSLFGRTLSIDQIKQTAMKQTPFADGILAGLSELIGLRDGQSQMNYQDFLDEEEKLTAQFYFKKKPKAQSDIPAGEIRLGNGFDPDDTPMLFVYPAGWPIPVGKQKNVKWMILSRGAGFSGGTATIRVSGPDGLVLSKGAMKGFKFHNGQIVGDLETRPTDKDHVKDYYAFEVRPTASAFSGSQLYTAEFPNLSIPPMTAGRTTQILILFALYDLEPQTVGEWEINVSIQPGVQTEYQHNLPPLRIAAVQQGWLPVVSGLNAKTTYDKSNLSANHLRELNYKQSEIPGLRSLDHPAVTSSVAILKDDGQPTLDASKTWLLAWLRPLADQQEGEIRIHAEKRMSESAYVGKTKKNLPVLGFLSDKTWGKLFDCASNYQTVLVTFVPKETECALAGIGLQRSLGENGEKWRESYERNLADTFRLMRGRPFDSLAHGATWHVFKWVINHADCYKYLETSAALMEKQLDGFAADHLPLQAWSSQCTWIPMFDRADSYERTAYEEASLLNWFRGISSDGGGLNDMKMTAQWCGNVLRMVTPHLWLCRNLIDQVNRAALERVAHVSETNGVHRIALRPGCALDELELALLPILPVESARISVV
jgi:hypothetical protein